MCLSVVCIDQRTPHPSKNILLLQKDPMLLLACFLAVEKRKGRSSFWAPYICELPEHPPCGWAQRRGLDTKREGPIDLPLTLSCCKLRSGKLKAFILRAEWGVSRGAFRQSAKAKLDLVESTARTYGQALKIDRSELQWALGMVSGSNISCASSLAAAHEVS